MIPNVTASLDANEDSENALKALEELLKKQELSNYIVTQMCFDAERIAAWLRDIRQRGVHLPVWLGLPGVSERGTLLKTSLRIGVGDSLRFLKKNGRIASRLLMQKEYRPDALLHDLAPYVADPDYGIAGYHIYCFNLVGKTEQWRHDFLEELG